jgi:hypothetical protein
MECMLSLWFLYPCIEVSYDYEYIMSRNWLSCFSKAVIKALDYIIIWYVGWWIRIDVAGFPWKFTMRILDEWDLTFFKALATLVQRRIPTPPIAASLSFPHAKDVFHCMESYRIFSSCTILCSWMPRRSILYLLKFTASSCFLWLSDRVLTFRGFLQLTNFDPFCVHLP